MKQLFRFLLTLFLLTPIFGFSINRSKIGDKIIREFSREITKSKKWKLYVSGGSFYNPKKIVITIGFTIHEIKNKSEIRRIIIETTEALLCFIKSENNFKKIFSESELTYNNIDLILSFDIACTQTQPEMIAHVISSDSTITYYYRDSDTNDLIALKDGFETYEEVRAIVMQEKCDQENVKKHDH